MIRQLLEHARLGAALTLILITACASGAAVTPNTTVPPSDVELEASQPGTVPEVEPDMDPNPIVPNEGVVAGLDTITAGRFDNGRMWTFDHAPVEYFGETYGITPDAAWFDHARLGALRIPGCSASFVSDQGLVLTNHHCAREHVTAVSEEGETFLDDGFYAESLSDERVIPDFEADQLIEIRDVTAEIDAALANVMDDEARSTTRQEMIESIQDRILGELGGEESGHHVEVISLYQGGRYSAYIFRRFTDVRLVMAPELQLGYFGGDPDNFTYPRYSLDFTLLRVYDNDQPLDSGDHYFRWSEDGVSEGDAVFVIGNPGSTSRIQTVAELEFRRDVSDKGVLEFINRRIAALQEFSAIDPEAADRLDLRNETFSLLNQQKAMTGQISGMADPSLMARKADGERQFLEAIAASPELSAKYSNLVDQMAAIQEQKRAVAPGFGSFLALTVPQYGSATMTRGIAAFQFLNASMAGAPEETIAELRDEFLAVPQQPARFEEILLEARFDDLIANYGENDPGVQAILQGRTPEGAAAVIVSGTVLADSAGAAAALESGGIQPNDPALQLLQGLIGLLQPFQQVAGTVGAQEEELAAQLGRARFDVYGTDVPPDATFSLRIADGVVSGYDYNGTEAPFLTTFFGLYDRYYSNAHSEDGGAWALPDRWVNHSAAFDLDTPMNFVSTADIIGGNSGSPVVNTDLELVGLAFDGNIESLPGDYIFLTDKARTVSVDARGILEALRDLYGASRIVDEVTAGAAVGGR